MSTSEDEVYKASSIRSGITVWDPYPFCSGQCCTVKEKLKTKIKQQQ